MKRTTPYWIAGVAILSACASNPMKDRLDKNFVYNCSLALIDKGVKAVDADRICNSSFQSELAEQSRGGVQKAATAADAPSTSAVTANPATPAAITETPRAPAAEKPQKQDTKVDETTSHIEN